MDKIILITITTILLLGIGRGTVEVVVEGHKIFPYILSSGFLIKKYENIDCTGQINHMFYTEEDTNDVCILPYDYYMDCNIDDKTCNFGFCCECKNNCSKKLSVGECYYGYKLFFEPLDYRNSDWSIVTTMKYASNPNACNMRPDGIALSRKSCSKLQRYDVYTQTLYEELTQINFSLDELSIGVNCTEDCGDCGYVGTALSFYCLGGAGPGQEDYVAMIGDYWWFSNSRRSTENY
ncbi:hypothetical protein DFA_02563 [Cavenderia fasciculata]|uniref:Uncharacterized protein n=1 Tax=Cavenderia fasciculata TaxID=261658 RepID=F4PZR0_CACFS|nr:uncharacterized protein DFA_02563 [Cavenderia fasciculata]EGG18824.1 hypothetical protein DFA_02563 [Cavenderia fasciculata]|eukprot:XP_004357286.1 hypothetical protein DFA_02563 [Cavenderia fasciculata]